MTIHSIEDPRIRRTKRLLRTAFLQLLQEKNIEQITVTDVIQTADYNRSTFYRHYPHIEAFIEDLLTEEITNLLNIFKAPYRNHPTVHLTALKPEDISLFDYISGNKTFYKEWTKLNVHQQFKMKFIDEIQSFYANEIMMDLPHTVPLDRQFYTSFYAHGIYGLIFKWISGGFQQSPRFMSEQLCYIMTYQPDVTSLLANGSTN